MTSKCTSARQLISLLTGGFLFCWFCGSIAVGADYLISTQADFDTYRTATFSPGDNVLFERGKTFTGMFSPTTVGAAGNMIKISTFGSGPKPVISNNGVIHPHPTRAGQTVSAGVLLFNAEYVELDGLEITNTSGVPEDDKDMFGIYVLGEDTGKYHNSIHIKNNYVHNVNPGVADKRRGGIHVHGYSPTSSNTATYNDLRIVNNRIDQIGGVGIGTDVDDLVNAHDYVGRHRENAITNLYVAHNWIGNTGRNSVIARDSDYAVYEYNTSANSSLHSTGHSFFNFRTLGMTWQYNEAYGNVGEQAEHDRGGFDADYNSKDTVIQYNYSHDNDWFVGIMKKPNTNVIIRHNLSVNDGGAYHYGFENDSDVLNIDAYNNTHYFGAGINPELVPLGRTPHETTFNNNIFYAVDQGTAGPGADDGVNVVFNTNAYYNVTPPNSETNALGQDPKFLSPGAVPRDVDMEFGRSALDGYRLTASSPYHNNGVAIAGNGGFDFWGQPLTSNIVGASQFDANLQIAPSATLFPGSAFPEPDAVNVVAATPDAISTFGDDARASLAQSFQVDTSFALKTIYLAYEYDPSADPNDLLINIEVFEVEDVTASDLVQGTSLLTVTGLAMPNNGNAHEAAIVLDSAVPLEANSGSAGYALRITGGNNPGFEWRRTGSSSGSVYALGQAYEDGVERFGGERDFVLALSAANPFGGLSGDFNNDGVVDLADYTVWRDNLGGNEDGSVLSGNGNGGIVDATDYVVWKNNFGSTSAESSELDGTLVPEPLSAMLLLIGIGAKRLMVRER